MSPTPTPPLTPMQVRHQAWLEEAGTMTMSLARTAHQRATDQLAETEPAPQAAKDESIRFTALVRCLRQTIAAEARHEARVAAGPATARTPRTARQAHLIRAADPRLLLLRRTLHHAVRNDPDRAMLRRTVDADLIELGRTDPDGKIPIHHILLSIARKLAIPIDLAQVPDALLGNPEDDSETYADDPAPNPESDPATTDPPT